jgi:hypothetical protein
LTKVDGDEANDKRKRGDDLKVDEALDADAADALEIAMAGDTGDERSEDKGSDDGFDEAKEDIAEDPERNREMRSIKTQLGASNHSDEDPGGKSSAARCKGGKQSDCNPTNRKRN